MIRATEAFPFTYVQACQYRQGGSVNSPAVANQYDTVDEARDAAKQLMHEHQRVVRVMIVDAQSSGFVEWMDRS